MSPKLFRPAALLTALALVLTACSAGGSGSGSSGTEEPTGGQSLEAVPALASEPDPGPEPEPGPRLTQEDVDRALEQVMDRYPAAGVTVATVERGQLSQSGAWGWAVKGEREMTPDTKIRIASISKVVVAMCTMAMAEDGLLDLDAPISEYWGSGAVNPYSKNQPTVRDFMTHTSSMKDLGIIRGLSTLRGLLQSRFSWRNMEPGSGGYWYYSNSGISVLGTTLELAANRILEDYLQERLLEPLGIRASFFAVRLSEDELANLYQTSSIGRSISQQRFGSYTEIGKSAALFPGGLYVSAVDMAKLVSVLTNDGVYKEPAYKYYQISSADESKDVEYVIAEPYDISLADENKDVEYVIVGSDEAVPAGRKEGVEYIIAEPIEGKFKETHLLSAESVADLETPRFKVDLDGYAPFEQCLILRRQEDVLGQEALYYHTGSAYGVFSLMTYNPVTQNGVVVITTGTPRNMNEHGMYALCYDLMNILYEKMEAEPE